MSDNVPVYIQIHDEIRRLIEKGQWKIGDRLPSERELAQEFNVSRMTLRQAIQTLADEGIVERKIGSGTYVARRKVQETMAGATSFTDIVMSQGKIPSSRTVSYKMTIPSSSEIEALQLNGHEHILRMERIRYADDEPICVETTSIPYHLIQPLDREDITKSLYRSFEEKTEYRLGKAKQVISAALATERIAELLDVHRASAILVTRQITYLSDGHPFEYVRSQYVGDRFEFMLER